MAKNQEENLLGELREAEFFLLLPVTVMNVVIIIYVLSKNYTQTCFRFTAIFSENFTNVSKDRTISFFRLQVMSCLRLHHRPSKLVKAVILLTCIWKKSDSTFAWGIRIPQIS
jgi:hypothetical protein